MAIGTVTSYTNPDIKSIVLLASTTAANNPPSGSGNTVGLFMADVYNIFSQMPTELTLMLYSTAGSGTMSVSARLWGYTPANGGMWFPMGIGADATKGMINAGSAMGETAADKIRHTETISLPGHFERLYLEITAISGTSTAVTAELVLRRSYTA